MLCRAMVKQRKIVGIWPAPTSDEAQSGREEPLELTADAMMALPEPDIAAPSSTSNGMDPRDWLDDSNGHSVFGDSLPDERHLPWVGIALAVLAAAWIFAVAWTATGSANRLPAASDMIQWIAIAATPLALILMLWLALERGSHSSTARHLRLLAALRDEQKRLDQRLAAIDGHWHAAQNALQQRARDAETAIGSSTHTIETATQRLDDTVRNTVTSAGLVVQQTEVAARHLNGLEVALPKAEDVARRVSETLQGAAHSAYQQGARLEEQLAAVQSDAGDIERRVDTALVALAARLADVGTAGSEAELAAQVASTRFASALDDQRVGALAMLADLAANLETSSDMVETRMTEARTRIVSAATTQLAALDTAIAKTAASGAEIDAGLLRTTERNDALGAALAEAVTAIESRLTQFTADTNARLATMTDLVRSASADIDRMTDAGERNSETVEQMMQRIEVARAQLGGFGAQIANELPQSLEKLNKDVERVRAGIATLPALVSEGSIGAAAMVAQIAEAERLLEQQAQQMTALDAGGRGMLEERGSALAGLRATIDALAASITALEEERLPSLEKAVDAGSAAAQSALVDLETKVADSIAASSGAIEQIFGSAVDAALGSTASARLEQLSVHADEAVAAAAAATEQLTRQLSALNAASAAVEARSGAFAQSMQRHDSEALARQMALTSEALQAMSVDMARVLDSDISDQAWQAWLKGDRGVFARRTVRLLTAAEARDVHRRYGEDEAFRALVNHYIHDFEAMLRRIVDAPEGDALTVTLLSSDIGKIYVALAQAIERLRN